MKDEEKILLQLLGRALFQSQTTFEASSVNWVNLHREAAAHAVSLLIYDCLTQEERKMLPPALSSRWEEEGMTHLIRNEQLLYEQTRVIRSLEEAQIPCVILKGSSVGHCYPNPQLRSYGDLDLLVRPEQQREAVAVLQKQWYGEVLEESHHCHMTVRKGEFSVEIHREPNGIFLAGKMGEKIRAYFADAVDRRVFVDSLPCLEREQQAVSLLLHMLEHFLTSGLGLRQLCDWALFVHRESGWWESLAPLLEEFGLRYFAGVVTQACVMYLGLPGQDAPWAQDSDAALASDVMEQILQDGNFGCKTERYGERLFSYPNTGGRIRSFFRVLTEACREHWPACERHAVLMPVAPFVLLAYYLRLRKEGRRPTLHPVKMYRQAGTKQDLYRSLRPFYEESGKAQGTGKTA